MFKKTLLKKVLQKFANAKKVCTFAPALEAMFIVSIEKVKKSAKILRGWGKVFIFAVRL